MNSGRGTRVLVTGSAGRVGRAVVEELLAGGVDTRGYDRSDGQDVGDTEMLTAALRGCHALVHLAAIPGDGIESPADTLAHNVVGVWSALLAARTAGVARVVFMSSIQATGVAEGHRDPDYLPLDDNHPSYAAAPYALSKLLGERACAAFTATTGIPTVCLRPPQVFAPDRRDAWAERIAHIDEASDEHWNYGSWIDVRDLAMAVRCALNSPPSGHHVFLVAALDAAGAEPPLQVIRRRYPVVPFRGDPSGYPYAGLIDVSRAVVELGWRPEHTWRPVGP